MTNNHMVDSVLAIVMGTGIGMLLSIGGQKLLNNHYQSTCNSKPNYNLIYSQTILGDTYYCIKDAYLK